MCAAENGKSCKDFRDTPGDDWHSVAVCSDGSYNVEKGLISSFPVRVRGGKWEIVQSLPINDFSREKIDASVAELKEEKSLVSEFISLTHPLRSAVMLSEAKHLWLFIGGLLGS